MLDVIKNKTSEDAQVACARLPPVQLCGDPFDVLPPFIGEAGIAAGSLHTKMSG
jgi:hypothetical protein